MNPTLTREDFTRMTPDLEREHLQHAPEEIEYVYVLSDQAIKRLNLPVEAETKARALTLDLSHRLRADKNVDFLISSIASKLDSLLS